MEHAVPQNVTSFEFHLVGDMTLRQFAFLASGAVASYITYAIFFPISPYISLPFIILFAASGAALAFLPFGGRPLDHWLVSYFKAVTSPTQGLWIEPKITNLNPALIQRYGSAKNFIYQNRFQLYLSSLDQTVSTQPSVSKAPQATPPSVKPMESKPNTGLSHIVNRISQDETTNDKRQTINEIQPLPTKEELNDLVNMAKFAQTLRGKIQQTEREIESLKTGKNYQTQYKTLSTNLQDLVQQTEDLYEKTSEYKKEMPAQKPAHVVVVKPEEPKQTQLILTSSPNVINGVVCDVAGTYLEGVIVIIHDKDNIPVRAVKTNKLGQFAGATPLPSGVYTVTLEKDNLIFDTLQITLDGGVLAPLNIMAKKGGLV